jgi:hypothetical protein
MLEKRLGIYACDRVILKDCVVRLFDEVEDVIIHCCCVVVVDCIK